jgi:hypothetical protein
MNRGREDNHAGVIAEGRQRGRQRSITGKQKGRRGLKTRGALVALVGCTLAAAVLCRLLVKGAAGESGLRSSPPCSGSSPWPGKAAAERKGRIARWDSVRGRTVPGRRGGVLSLPTNSAVRDSAQIFVLLSEGERFSTSAERRGGVPFFRFPLQGMRTDLYRPDGKPRPGSPGQANVQGSPSPPSPAGWCYAETNGAGVTSTPGRVRGTSKRFRSDRCHREPRGPLLGLGPSSQPPLSRAAKGADSETRGLVGRWPRSQGT